MPVSVMLAQDVPAGPPGGGPREDAPGKSFPSMGASEAEDSPLYKTDSFRMWCFKVLPCSKRYVHDWTVCPFAHPGEKAKRRDPRVFSYTGIACPDMKKCQRGDACPYAHNVFEYWMHPSRYRTQLCNDGIGCKRKVCFFAHTLDELRVSSVKLSAEAGADGAFELDPFKPRSDAARASPKAASLAGSASGNDALVEALRVQQQQQQQQAAKKAAAAARSRGLAGELQQIQALQQLQAALAANPLALAAIAQQQQQQQQAAVDPVVSAVLAQLRLNGVAPQQAQAGANIADIVNLAVRQALANNAAQQAAAAMLLLQQQQQQQSHQAQQQQAAMLIEQVMAANMLQQQAHAQAQAQAAQAAPQAMHAALQAIFQAQAQQQAQAQHAQAQMQQQGAGMGHPGFGQGGMQGGHMPLGPHEQQPHPMGPGHMGLPPLGPPGHLPHMPMAVPQQRTSSNGMGMALTQGSPLGNGSLNEALSTGAPSSPRGLRAVSPALSGSPPGEAALSSSLQSAPSSAAAAAAAAAAVAASYYSADPSRSSFDSYRSSETELGPLCGMHGGEGHMGGWGPFAGSSAGPHGPCGEDALLHEAKHMHMMLAANGHNGASHASSPMAAPQGGSMGQVPHLPDMLADRMSGMSLGQGPHCGAPPFGM